MNVYRNCDFWYKPLPGEPALKEVFLHQSFLWEDLQVKIPAMYLGQDTLALDVCIQIQSKNMQEIRDFSMHVGMVPDLLLDEKKLKRTYSCSVIWSPFLPDAAATTVEEMLLREYHCSKDYGWNFIRYEFQCEKPGVIPQNPKSISLLLKDMPTPVLAGTFSTEEGCTGKIMEIRHPITGKTHTLTVKECSSQQMDFPLQEDFFENYEQLPAFYQSLLYEVQPDLESHTFQLTDHAPGDSPVLKPARKDKSAASVSVIGGVSGPTALFWAGKADKPSCHMAVSSLHYQPVKEVTWNITFYVKKRAEKKLSMFNDCGKFF